MLHAVMQPAARERLARIALVKPDKARGVENMILGAAQRGQLGERVGA
jgi:programmed cell death protein 5